MIRSTSLFYSDNILAADTIITIGSGFLAVLENPNVKINLLSVQIGLSLYVGGVRQYRDWDALVTLIDPNGFMINNNDFNFLSGGDPFEGNAVNLNSSRAHNTSVVGITLDNQSTLNMGAIFNLSSSLGANGSFTAYTTLTYDK